MEWNKSLIMQEQMKKERAVAVLFHSLAGAWLGRARMIILSMEKVEKIYMPAVAKKGAMLGTSAAERNAEHSDWKGRGSYQQ